MNIFLYNIVKFNKLIMSSGKLILKLEYLVVKNGKLKKGSANNNCFPIHVLITIKDRISASSLVTDKGFFFLIHRCEISKR